MYRGLLLARWVQGFLSAFGGPLARSHRTPGTLPPAASPTRGGIPQRLTPSPPTDSIRRASRVKNRLILNMARKIDHCDCILARRGGRFGARGEGRGAMKTAKFQVGRPRGWVRAPIVSGGRIRAMMRGCGVALPGSSPLDLRLCRPHHIYICNVSVSSRSVSGQNAVPGIGSDSGKHERECEIRWRRPDPTSSRRCVRAYRNMSPLYFRGTDHAAPTVVRLARQPRHP